MQRLIDSCEKNLVFLDIQAREVDEAIVHMIDGVVTKGELEESLKDKVLTELARKESESSTSIGHALTVPHAYLEEIDHPIIAIGRLDHAINTGAPDGTPTKFIFLLLGPTQATSEHLDSLANIARLMSDDEFRYLATEARNAEDFAAAIKSRISGEEAAQEHAQTGEGLRYTGKLFGGIVGDIRRRKKHYLSDFTDGLHAKTLASTFFLYFACLAPAIIFGGLMEAKTGGDGFGVGQIGAVEMIVATAICGIAYALFSGQPMIILGGTGPMLIFTAILYDFCIKYNVDFLPAYAWVGIWTAAILLILAATDASRLMRYFTRFTDEIFAALISVIFIYEAVSNLIKIFHKVGAGEAVAYDVALLSLVLALGTFYVAMSMSRFRKSHLLVPSVREFLADFGPTIAILSMALVAFLARGAIEVDELKAPETFSTTSGRPWLVPFLTAPVWVIFSSIIPALLCCVLVYLDQNITARLINSPDNKLKKGEAYHLDLGLVGVLVGVCSLFGLPWLVAATVRSLNHVRSLATTEEVFDKGGTAHTRILHVLENRVAPLAIHVLVALSLLLLPYLKYIPMPVLFGLFLYMGVVSIKGNQFFERLSLWATDPALYPSTHFVRRVPTWVMHGFTMVQLLCLVVLWVVKSSAIGILFPLFIALLVPIRILLNRFIKAEHLMALDAEENPEEEEESWN